MILTKRPKCPHCGTIIPKTDELELEDINGSLVCGKCNNRFFFDTELIILYKTWKTLKEYATFANIALLDEENE